MKTRLFAAFAASTLLISSAAPAAGALKTAVFAGGCFWSAEHDIEHTPGIKGVVVGYAGGNRPNPTYDNGHEGYLESIQVTYDPAVISYPKLVDTFFHHIDPTDPNGQICDQGPTYRTAVFVADPAEKAAAEQVKEAVHEQLRLPIKTMILPAGKFWPEPDAHHQHYAEKYPANYMAYRIGCGRDRTLKAVWAKAPGGLASR
jgi:peptide-methionine (S)-S-oxide reductase